MAVDKKQLKSRMFSLGGIAILLDIFGIINLFFFILFIRPKYGTSITDFLSALGPLVFAISGIILASLAIIKKDSKSKMLGWIGLWLGILLIILCSRACIIVATM